MVAYPSFRKRTIYCSKSTDVMEQYLARSYKRFKNHGYESQNEIQPVT